MTRTLMKYVKGPDLPTGGEIISPRSELLDIYNTGNGSFKARAVYKEDKDEGSSSSPSSPTRSRATRSSSRSPRRCARRSCPWSRTSATSRITRNRSASSSSPRRRTDVAQLMAHLFATTDLERNYRVNLNVITLEGKPRVMGLRDLLNEWLQFRTRPSRAACSSGSTRSISACTSSTACWRRISISTR